ncbi:DUF2314 domain-containing protein [Roseiconus lacunae]|uniref:YegJ family protein n=1 Tax=Roseiconus lacunae TaxID=2605694 RepID=UPI0030899361|nr:DUF2314 domain-containing protein [Stieleria sp. HD01]
MRLTGLLAIGICLIGCSAPDAETPETLVTSGYDQDAMEQAIRKAQNSVSTFVAELENPTGSDHAVKAPIEDDGETEHFWLTNLDLKDGVFTGIINNEPGIVSNVKIGQSWTIKQEEISDWMFMKDGMMHGNYTLRPLLETMPAEQADQLRAILVDP